MEVQDQEEQQARISSWDSVYHILIIYAVEGGCQPQRKKEDPQEDPLYAPPSYGSLFRYFMYSLFITRNQDFFQTLTLGFLSLAFPERTAFPPQIGFKDLQLRLVPPKQCP